MLMKRTAIILILSLLIACNAQKKQAIINSQKPDWAFKFADAVMTRFDSLIYYNNGNPNFGYDNSFLGSAIDKLGGIDKKYSDYMQTYVDYFVRNNGTIKGYNINEYNIDRIRPGLNILTLYERTGNENYKIAAEKILEQVKSQPRTNAGGFWHKKVYPYQMWLDGLYMASPFLAHYAKDFNKPQWFDEVTFQLKVVREKTLDSITGLQYHAWDESKEQRWCNPETGQSKHFWSRATGWYMMALVDVLEVLPENHKDRADILKILNDLSEALLKVQDRETGLWYQVLDMGGREGNYLETSGSAMFIYTFAKGVKNGFLNKKYLDIANKSFDSMVKTMVITGDDGLPTLTNICGACGLGGNPYREGDYNYYISEKRVDNDSKGVAPFILAAIELNK